MTSKTVLESSGKTRKKATPGDTRAQNGANRSAQSSTAGTSAPKDANKAFLSYPRICGRTRPTPATVETQAPVEPETSEEAGYRVMRGIKIREQSYI